MRDRLFIGVSGAEASCTTSTATDAGLLAHGRPRSGGSDRFERVRVIVADSVPGSNRRESTKGTKLLEITDLPSCSSTPFAEFLITEETERTGSHRGTEQRRRTEFPARSWNSRDVAR